MIIERATYCHELIHEYNRRICSARGNPKQEVQCGKYVLDYLVEGVGEILSAEFLCIALRKQGRNLGHMCAGTTANLRCA